MQHQPKERAVYAEDLEVKEKIHQLIDACSTDDIDRATLLADLRELRNLFDQAAAAHLHSKDAHINHHSGGIPYP